MTGGLSLDFNRRPTASLICAISTATHTRASPPRNYPHVRRVDVCTGRGERREGRGRGRERERADLHTKCGVACQRRIQLGCIDAIVDAMQMRQRAERLLLRGRLDREACSRVRDTAFRGSWGKGKKREYGLRGLAIDR